MGCQIHVTHSDTGQPLAKVYVKVYAQMQAPRLATRVSDGEEL
jgi:hypothetical protein